MQHQTVPQTREIPAHDIEPGMTVIDGVDGRLVVTARYADGADAILVSFADVPEPTRFGSGVTVLVAVAVADGEMTTATESTGLEHALAEILTAVNGIDPVGAYDDYDDCSADELHIHKQLNRIRDRITVIRAENDLPMDGADTVEQPKPDYWLTLADDVRKAADRIATLAGTPGKPSYVAFTICAGLLRSQETSAVPMVDAIAKALSVEPTTGDHNRTGTWDHRATATIGTVEVTAYANATKPADVEDHLRARVAELEAKLAEGGAAR